MQEQPLTREEFVARQQQTGIRVRQNALLRRMVGGDRLLESGGSQLSGELAQLLGRIDSKLDYLIGMGMLNDAARADLNERAVNLSSGGMSFRSREHYCHGDPIQLTVMLSSFPPALVELLAQVMRVDDDDGVNRRVAVRFHFRSEEEEETLTRYIYQRQRELLRQRVDLVDPQGEASLKTGSF